jgi:hypothetical protein
MKIERLKTGVEQTFAGKKVVGRKPARNGRSRVSFNFEFQHWKRDCMKQIQWIILGCLLLISVKTQAADVLPPEVKALIGMKILPQSPGRGEISPKSVSCRDLVDGELSCE